MKQDYRFSTEKLQDIFQGCLLGMAIGDVIGAPIEGMSPNKIKNIFEQVNCLVTLPINIPINPYFWRLSGLHTDDTQQALAITDVFLKTGALHEFSVLAIWQEMARDKIIIEDNKGLPREIKKYFGSHRGTGGSLRHRIKYPHRPVSVFAGDGAAMRVAPIALFYYDNEKKRIDAAIRSALLTHRHPLAILSTVAVSAAIAAIIQYTDDNARKILQYVIQEVKNAENIIENNYKDIIRNEDLDAISVYSIALKHMKSLLNPAIPNLIQNPSVQKDICSFAKKHDSYIHDLNDENIFITKNHALLAVYTAILIALRNLDNYKAAIIEAVNLGGDTDTVAAITGAIVGARSGLHALPEDWCESVFAKNEILVRAQALATQVNGKIEKCELEKKVVWEDIVTLERRLTIKEAQTADKIFFNNSEKT